MNTFRHISVPDAKALIEQGEVQLADIRDAMSFQQGHIPGAVRIDNTNAQDFIENGDRAKPLVVCCYHGISSQSAAQFFAEQGFAEVYSLDGGFEAWRSAALPTE